MVNDYWIVSDIEDSRKTCKWNCTKKDMEESNMSQLFGMDNILSSLSGKYENKVNQEASKVGNTKNTIGKPELSETASKYYEELKAKYGDMEFVLVDDKHIETAKEQASNIHSNKSMLVLISESELEEMATNEETRTKNEKILEDAKAQMPDILEQIKESGVEVKSFGIEIKDGTASYFAVVDKSMAAQKERIENNSAEKRAEKKADEKEAAEKASAEKLQLGRPGQKEDLTTVSASSIEELVKKLQDMAYEAKADTVRTKQEMMVGQSFDFSI